MPTTRRRRRQGRRDEPITDALRMFFETGQLPPGAPLKDQLLMRDSSSARRVWREYRAELLPEFVVEHPGTRPHAWWRFDAPEPSRRRLGGIGTPSPEVLAYAPTFAFGLPVHWVTDWDVAFYNGRAHDVHGQRIGTSHHEGDFKGVAIDPRDPPRFESEASYLKRHGVLTRDERAQLPADAFAPEHVGVDYTEEEER